jgi:hypothetical protein
MQFLGRSADPGGLATYLAQFQAGLSAEAIVTEIIGSQEYALRASNGQGSSANPTSCDKVRLKKRSGPSAALTLVLPLSCQRESLEAVPESHATLAGSLRPGSLSPR